MLFSDWTAENRIQRAMESGEFDHLAGSGKPLCLETARSIVAKTRGKNNGHSLSNSLPEELVLRLAIDRVGDWLIEAKDDEIRGRLAYRMEELLHCLGQQRGIF